MLKKDTANGAIFGVCAGIAKTLGLNISIVRLLTICSFFVTGSITFWIYVVLALILQDENQS